MYRVLFIYLIALIFPAILTAQNFTLQQCIDTALANNIPVKQKYLLVQSAEVDWHQSRSNILPNLMGNVYHGTSQGKSIDPSTNTYATQNLNYANYQLNSGITVFNGGNLQNNIKQYATAYEAAKMEWKQAKDNLVLDVILAYLQVLSNEDLVTSSIKQAEISQRQLERYQVLDSQGAIRPSDLSDLKGQLMNDQLSIVINRNALETSRLLLLQLMNKPYNANIQFQQIDVDEFLTTYNNSPDRVFENALQQFSLIRAVELRKRSLAYSVKSARGQMYPTLIVDGGLNTRYSSIDPGKNPYNTQLNNNLATFLEVGVSIPIFNRFYYRNRVKQADILYKNSELIEENTRLQLHQQIDQAYLNMTNAYEKYKILMDQVNAYTESFKAAEVRFNAGAGKDPILEYLTAKDRLDRSRISLINAKYDFVLRKKILDYYNGK